jgi:hypothetical protein
MSTLARRKLSGWRVFWILLGGAFLFSTAPTVWRGLGGQFGGVSEFHSSDLYLQGLTDMPHCSERFIRFSATVPTQKPILIVVRKGSLQGSLMGMIMSYLAWPHATVLITVPGADCATELARIAPDSISAIAFCEVQPPSWLHGAIPLGSTTSLVVLQRKAEAK